MTKSKQRQFRNLPRRTSNKKKPSWCIFIRINGDRDFFKIYFGAYNEGNAKNKALPKIQGYLMGLNICGSPKLDILVKKITGSWVPDFTVRPRFAYYMSLIAIHAPSKVFMVRKKNMEIVSC